MQTSPVLSFSPSFNSYSAGRLEGIAARVVEEFRHDSEGDVFYSEGEDPPGKGTLKYQLQVEEEQVKDESVDEEDDFEFSFVGRESESSPISADEIFFNGQIKPYFPIFNRDLLSTEDADNIDDLKPLNRQSPGRTPLRKLLNEERDSPSSSSSEADELEGVLPGTYCVWAPKPPDASPGRCKKSNSTGSSKRWRFRDLLPRSNSEGKDTFIFLTSSGSSKKRVEKSKPNDVSKEVRTSSEVKVTGTSIGKGFAGENASAHEMHYVRSRAVKTVDRRRSFLPYRQDLVGFFANVNGLSRNLHPF